jgi:hypothetical protein
MIFFYGEGRLGNQIFQYQALSHIAKPGERIIAVGLEELAGSFDLRGPSLLVLTRIRALKIIVKHAIKPLLLRPISRTLRLINYATEGVSGQGERSGKSGAFTIRAGLLRSATFVDGGHYQNSSYWTGLFPAPLLSINVALRSAARKYLDSIDIAGRRATFLHVRRSDYLTHTDYGLDNLSLPVSYYRSAIGELARYVDKPHLIFVTDDPLWVEENFKDIPDKAIASFDAGMDFAIMAECAAGVVSNSTFSLAAAFLLKNPDVVIGPQYWFGFRVKAWYPPKMRFEHPKLVYIPADS